MNSPILHIWKILIFILGISGYVIEIFREKNGTTICKQWRPWSDVWSGSALFANYPFRGFQTKMWGGRVVRRCRVSLSKNIFTFLADFYWCFMTKLLKFWKFEQMEFVENQHPVYLPRQFLQNLQSFLLTEKWKYSFFFFFFFFWKLMYFFFSKGSYNKYDKTFFIKPCRKFAFISSA